MFRIIIHTCVATVAMWAGAVWAQQWDDAPRAADVNSHFYNGWNDDGHFRGGDAMDRTLNRAPIRFAATLDPTGDIPTGVGITTLACRITARRTT